jgi:hypothetical protein
MPNLDHDPQNPTDLLDRPIAVGDIVAWGTTYGKSPAVAVCRIEKIRFFYKPDPWGPTIECDQAAALDYQLVVKLIKTTGSEGYGSGPRKSLRNIKLVKNVVKLEPMS